MKTDLRWLYSILIGIALLAVGILFFMVKGSIDILTNLLFSFILIGSGLSSLYALNKNTVEDKKAKNTSYGHIIFTLIFGFAFLIFALTATKSMLSPMLIVIGVIITINGIGVLYEAFVYAKLTKTYRLNLIVEGIILILLGILAIAYRDSLKGVLRYIIGIISVVGSLSYFIRAKVLYSRKKANAEYEVLD